MSPEIVLSDAVRGRDELPEGVRVRIALDVLAEIDADAALSPRSSASRCRWDRVRIDEEGRARLSGDGDSSGAAWLLWEMLAGRSTSNEETPPRVHDVVDQIHPDLDDAVARAFDGDPETVGELFEVIARSGEGSTGEHIDVLRALGLAPEAAPPEPLPAPRTPTPPPPAPRDPTPPPPAPRDPTPPPPAPREPTAPPPAPREPTAPPPAPVAPVSESRALEPIPIDPAGEPSPPEPPAPELAALDSPAAPTMPAAVPSTAVEADEFIAALQDDAFVSGARASTRPRAASIEPPPDSLSAWGFTPEPMPASPKVPILDEPIELAPVPDHLIRAMPPSASQIPPPDDAWGPPSSSSRGSVIPENPLAETHPPLSLPPFVLLVKGDETDDAPLATMIRSAGYGLLVRHDATSGFLAARQVLPDVIVVDAELDEGPGEGLVRRIRADPSRLAATPIVLLAPAEATAVVDRAAGADAIIAKPYRFGDVVAEVAALVKMSAELRATREALPHGNAAEEKVFQLDLGEISLAVMLTIFEMERRSGVFDIRSEGRRAHLEIVGGHLTVGAALGRQLGPLGTLRTVLRWRSGRVAFRAITDRLPPDGAPSISEVLTEATRMMDEEDHDAAAK